MRMRDSGKRFNIGNIVQILLIVITIIVCTVPMSWNPYWNGEFPADKRQYEILAESMLKGHLYLDYDDIDPEFLAMENPYSPEEREALGVSFHWDHAWYEGHYYMYFGVAPVILLFLPYRFITGQDLPTYHATQLLSIFVILGLNCLFRYIRNKYFPAFPKWLTGLLATAVSFMSLWYAAEAPMLYCTAIVAGIACEVWSFFFFFKGIEEKQTIGRQSLYIFLGALLGAIVFGCRPPLALANVIVLPIAAELFRQHGLKKQFVGLFSLGCLPYIVTGGLLMLYNYARFDNPFEFGQAYQLTVANQTAYGSTGVDLAEVLKKVGNSFFAVPEIVREYPYMNLNKGGAFIYFPILFLSLLIFLPPVFRKLREQKIAGISSVILPAVLAIVFSQVLYAPWLVERYHMEIYYLIGILVFIVVGVSDRLLPSVRWLQLLWRGVLVTFSIWTVVCSAALFMVPNDYNLTEYRPELIIDLLGRL